LNEELEDMSEKYNELRNGNASKNNMNDDTPMCERHEANYIQSKGYHNRNSHDLFSCQSHYDPNDSEKSLTELNNDVRNDLEDFKRRICSMRTVHWKLYDSDDRKTTGVLPNKKSKTVNQEPQAKTDLEKSITKFLDGQRVTNMFFKNNVNDMILKMKQNEKNFQIKIKMMERKMDEWSKSQNISLEQTDWTEPQPPPQAQTEQVNVVFTGSGKSDDSPKTKKDPPPPIIVNNKTEKDKPIKTSKREYQVVKTNEYPYCQYIPKIPYGETQSEAIKLLIFTFSLCDKAKTWSNELNEESIISWEQMRRAFINRFFPPSLFYRLLLETRNFSQNICESLTEAWLRLKSMLRKCHGHGLTKGAIIQVFYHGLDESTQAILDKTVGGIFLYKSPNQAFQFLDDKVLFKLDWSTKSQNDHHQKSVSFVDGSDSNNDNSRFMEKLKAVDSQVISLNEELEDMREKYNELRNGNASKNNMNDETLTCKRHEANYIQSADYQNQNSHDSSSCQSLHDPNDSEKSLTELNNDVRKDLKDFKRCVRSMRTVHDKLYDRDDGKTTGDLFWKI
ncbi:reverse transcriptase domain-containing protein, partial [Tanacetum coccineum]